MKEIPIPYVRTNQLGIIALFLLGLFLQQPWVIVVLWVLQAASLTFGLKGNLFVQLVKPLLANKISGTRTEAAELQRFNNSIAVILLTASVLCFAIGWTIAGYILAGFVAAAALVAVCGYCIGCFLYYQLKKFKAGVRR